MAVSLKTLSLPTPKFVVGVYAITSICEMLDAASYLGLGHVFVEIMTGNLVYLAFSVGSTGSSFSSASVPAGVLPYVIALVTFAAGAVADGRLVRLGGWPSRWLCRRVVPDAGSARLHLSLHPTGSGHRRFVVVSILPFAMGGQNALLRQWGIKDLATNVMTLTLTGLLADSTLGGGTNPRAARRATSITIFVKRAVLGAFLVRFGVVWPITTAFLIFTVGLPSLLAPIDDRAATTGQPAMATG